MHGTHINILIMPNVIWYIHIIIITSNSHQYCDLVESNRSLSVKTVSPLGSQTSFSTLNQTRIETVADWEAIAKKYRALVGNDGEDSGSMKDGSDDEKSKHGEEGVLAAPPGQINSAAANLV